MSDLKLIAGVVIAVCAVLATAPAYASGQAGPGAVNVARPPVAVSPDRGGGRRKEWTVMVFLNAKNNLEEFGARDVNEMEQVGSTGEVNIVVQYARARGHYSGDGDWTGARRYLITRDSDTGRISSPPLMDLGPVDMGDYRNVVDFVRWAKAKYPAGKYLLVIWNHGSGWVRKNGGEKGISYDDESGNHINTPQLGRILAESGGVDVYASDACLMQMAEVAWELKDGAAYIVGSEETEPADGYPYDAVMAALAAAPAMAPGELSSVLVREYGRHYAALGVGVTLSAVRTSALPAFRGLVDEFASAAMAAGDKGVLKRGLYYAQHYSYDDNKDLASFLDYVAAKTADRRLRGAAVALSAYLGRELVPYKAAANYSQAQDGLEPVDYSLAGGLAVYLPGAKPASGYSGLKWAGDSSWDEFLNWLYTKERP